VWQPVFEAKRFAGMHIDFDDNLKLILDKKQKTNKEKACIQASGAGKCELLVLIPDEVLDELDDFIACIFAGLNVHCRHFLAELFLSPFLWRHDVIVAGEMDLEKMKVYLYC
jgi:hypothetical protein